MAKAKADAASVVIETDNMVQEVEHFVKAGFPAIWIQSCEHEEALQQLLALASKQNWALAHWDAADGLKGTDDISRQRTAQEHKEEQNGWFDKKPVKLMQNMQRLAQGSKKAKTLFILKNFHRPDWLTNSTVLQQLLNVLGPAKIDDNGWSVVILSPTVEIPVEWENEFVVVNHDLPTREDIKRIAEGLAEEDELPKNDAEWEPVIGAATGMTHRGVEGAFSLSIVRNKPFDPDVVQALKSQAVKRKGLLTIHEGKDSFDDLGGLESFKNFSCKLLRRDRTNPKLRPKGLLLLGVPGSGKSQGVKCLGNATGRRVLSMNMGSLRSKYQGETDRNIRQALKTADAMSPCILFIDELEKAFSGVQSSGMTDGGSGARVFGTFLSWLNDHTTDVFVVGTCNNIEELVNNNPEFVRAERFDHMFFFDLPTAEEREKIWRIYEKMYGVKVPKMERLIELSENWTGAEIQSCCRLSGLLEQSIEETAAITVPIVTKSAERLRTLRNWADGQCLSASQPGLYRYNEDGKPTTSSLANALAGSRKLARS